MGSIAPLTELALRASQTRLVAPRTSALQFKLGQLGYCSSAGSHCLSEHSSYNIVRLLTALWRHGPWQLQ